MNKPLKMMIFSLTSVTLLAACGNNNDTQDSTQQQEEQEIQQEQNQETPNDQESNDESNNQSSGQNQGETETSENTSNNSSGSDQTSNDNSSQGIQEYEFSTSLENARQIYREEVGGQNVSIEEIELDDDDGDYIYEIQGYSGNTEYDVDIDAESGEILETDSDEEDNNDEEVLNLENIITPQEAMQSALEQSGSGYVNAWTLDVDDGNQAYDVEIEDGSDQYVDSETGEILASDNDDDNDNNDDDNSDE